MNFLPKTLLDRNDLKRTVNSLILEDNSIPKPVIKSEAPVKPEKKEEPIPVASKLPSKPSTA
jgi:hypothetical protein